MAKSKATHGGTYYILCFFSLLVYLLLLGYNFARLGSHSHTKLATPYKCQRIHQVYGKLYIKSRFSFAGRIGQWTHVARYVCGTKLVLKIPSCTCMYLAQGVCSPL